MANRALITGASGGIGMELARYHAAKGGDLVLVARREDALNSLKQELINEHGIQVMVIAADLTQANAAQDIFNATEQANVQVDILINNAGVGGHGKFHERELEKDLAMMQLNMTSLVALTHLYMQGMIERKQGHILHVASTAAFMPGPLQAIYYATKSFVVSFSQAIAQELKDTGVSSTALCPGAVATGFVAAGDLDGLGLWDNAKTADSVAKFGYEAMEKKKLVAVNEFALGFMTRWIVPLLPRQLALSISESLMKK